MGILKGLLPPTINQIPINPKLIEALDGAYDWISLDPFPFCYALEVDGFTFLLSRRYLRVFNRKIDVAVELDEEYASGYDRASYFVELIWKLRIGE